MTGVEYLRTLHTKQILNLKNHHYMDLRFGGLPCTWKGTIVFVNYEDLKQVCSERPHILTRSETKRIRQIAAKSKIRTQSTRRESLNS
jgi:hypothetical protein